MRHCGGVQSWKQCNAILLLSPHTVTKLFLEWFFELQLSHILSTPAASASSGLQRWLQDLLAGRLCSGAAAKVDSDHEVDDSPDSSPSRLLFQHCNSTDALEHAFVLASCCAGVSACACCNAMGGKRFLFLFLFWG